MYHFFVEPVQISGRNIRITGEDVNHIRNVLRLKPGEEISVRNGIDGREYRCGIESVTDTEVSCTLRFIKESGVELPSRVYLFQGLPKGDKMEFIIQKMVELGVCGIIPVAMERCIVKLDDKKAKAKTARWQGISEAAAKQSGRGIIPKIHDVMRYREALDYAMGMDVRLAPYELAGDLEGAPDMACTRKAIESLAGGQSIAVFIGPEGGFGQCEIAAAIDRGFQPITLGRRILRTETAGMAVMAWIMYRLEA